MRKQTGASVIGGTMSVKARPWHYKLAIALFVGQGGVYPHRLNALVRHRSTNTRGKQFRHGNQGEMIEDDDSSFIDD